MACGKVTQLVAALGGIKKSDDPLRDISTNFTGAGAFCKYVPLKAGLMVISHKHKFDHLSLLLTGKVTVTTDDGVVEMTAPSSIIVKAGVHHQLVAHEDSTWLCVHATNSPQSDSDTIGE
jgi:quercetin dioxygenase-like cupin family protein